MVELSEGVTPLFHENSVLDGKYRLLRLLGEGGMGEVWEAENISIGRRVAIKGLHPHIAHDAKQVRRFEQEARSATAIGHENIVEVLDMGRLPGGSPFMVMEFLSGCELTELIDREAPMAIPRAVRILRQACHALDAAHQMGIVHRDLKPANIFLTEKGNDREFVKVLDFGISKIMTPSTGDISHTETGVTMGTPSYMSPEQAQGKRDTDHRTDVFSLGCILYEMLTGYSPFFGDNTALILSKILTQEPTDIRSLRQDVPADMAWLLMQTLQKDPGARVPSAGELAKALQPFESSSQAYYGDDDDDTSLCYVDTIPSGERPLTPAEARAALKDMPQQTDVMRSAELRAQSRGSKVMLALGAVGVGIAAAAVVAFQTDAPPPAVTKAPEKVVETKAPPPAPPPVAPAPKEVRVSLTAAPAGARITLGDQELENPAQLSLPIDKKQVRLRIVADGHSPHEEMVTLEKDLQRAVVLQKLPAPSGAEPAPTTRRPAKPATRPNKTKPKPPTKKPKPTKPKKSDEIYRGAEGSFRDDF